MFFSVVIFFSGDAYCVIQCRYLFQWRCILCYSPQLSIFSISQSFHFLQLLAGIVKLSDHFPRIVKLFGQRQHFNSLHWQNYNRLLEISESRLSSAQDMSTGDVAAPAVRRYCGAHAHAQARAARAWAIYSPAAW